MDQRELELLQAIVFEVTETARLHPCLDTNELALLILKRPDRSEMMTMKAISSLARRASSDHHETTQPTSTACFHAFELAAVPRTFPSGIEGWDLIDSSPNTTFAATDKKCLHDQTNELESKPTAVVVGPTENDIIITDCSIKVPKEAGGHVQLQPPPIQKDRDAARSQIHQCVILGTLVCMLVEMEQLRKKNPERNPFELAFQINEECKEGQNAAFMLYEAALAIALLVPFTPVSRPRGTDESDKQGSHDEDSSMEEYTPEATFLGHLVGNAHVAEPQQLASPTSNVAIEFLISEPKDDEWDGLYIGSVSDKSPQGVGCTMYVKKDTQSAAGIRTLFGTWDKGICLEGKTKDAWN